MNDDRLEAILEAWAELERRLQQLPSHLRPALDDFRRCLYSIEVADPRQLGLPFGDPEEGGD